MDEFSLAARSTWLLSVVTHDCHQGYLAPSAAYSTLGVECGCKASSSFSAASLRHPPARVNGSSHDREPLSSSLRSNLLFDHDDSLSVLGNRRALPVYGKIPDPRATYPHLVLVIADLPSVQQDWKSWACPSKLISVEGSFICLSLRAPFFQATCCFTTSTKNFPFLIQIPTSGFNAAQARQQMPNPVSATLSSATGTSCPNTPGPTSVSLAMNGMRTTETRPPAVARATSPITMSF